MIYKNGILSWIFSVKYYEAIILIYVLCSLWFGAVVIFGWLFCVICCYTSVFFFVIFKSNHNKVWRIIKMKMWKRRSVLKHWIFNMCWSVNVKAPIGAKAFDRQNLLLFYCSHSSIYVHIKHVAGFLLELLKRLCIGAVLEVLMFPAAAYDQSALGRINLLLG